LGINSAKNYLKALFIAQLYIKGTRNPALIIAFIRRFNIKDQIKAIRVKIDLFIIKPVAFKEVRKIIDN
jgi:DNA-binding response OmpR family regulator